MDELNRFFFRPWLDKCLWLCKFGPLNQTDNKRYPYRGVVFTQEQFLHAIDVCGHNNPEEVFDYICTLSDEVNDYRYEDNEHIYAAVKGCYEGENPTAVGCTLSTIVKLFNVMGRHVYG